MCRSSGSAAEQLAAGSFTGMHFVDEFKMACDIWKRPRHPDYPLAPVIADTPILIVAGGRDPITPVEYGERIARNFSRATLLPIEHMPHHSSGLPGSAECIDGILYEFITRGSMDGIDVGCAASLRAAPFDVAE